MKLALQVLLISLAGGVLPAQLVTAISLRGEVVADPGPLPAGLMVELQSDGESGPPMRADVDSRGGFSLPYVPAGTYKVRIQTHTGDSLHEDVVEVGRETTTINLHLHTAPREEPASGSISVARLAHRVPAKARKAFERGARESERGNSKSAIRHYEEAIRLDPEYLEAYTNLGVQYTRQGRLEEARKVLERAVALEPGSALAQVNFAYTLARLGQRAEAETAARNAIRIDPLLPKAHYVLGTLLALSPGREEEAIRELTLASEAVPHSHLVMAGVYARTGQRGRAVKAARAYRPASDEERQRVEQWIRKVAGADD